VGDSRGHGDGERTNTDLSQCLDSLDAAIHNFHALIEQGAFAHAVDARTGTCIEREELLAAWERFKTSAHAAWIALEGVRDANGVSMEAGSGSPRSRLLRSFYALERPRGMVDEKPTREALESAQHASEEIRQRLHIPERRVLPAADTDTARSTTGRPAETPTAVRLFVFDPSPGRRKKDVLVAAGQQIVAATKLPERATGDCGVLAKNRAIELPLVEKERKRLQRLGEILAGWGVQTELTKTDEVYRLVLESPFSFHTAGGSLDPGADLKQIVRDIERDRLLGRD
jgi:hypothetical protein